MGLFIWWGSLLSKNQKKKSKNQKTTMTSTQPTQTTPAPAAAPAAAPAGGNLPAQTQPGAPVPPPGRPQVSASLYIGDLDPEIGESALYDLFKEIGNVASIRVCRDAISRVSLGYGYVNFHTVEAAERAINVLNGELLNNRPCRIMWSRRDPSIRKSGVGNIFIKNLHPDIHHSDLYDIFATFGNIHSCKLVTDENGKSKGYGFVHYHSKDAAEQAIKKMNNLKLNDKLVYVAPFIPAKDRKAYNAEDFYTNVYIKNVGDDVTEDEFVKEFSRYGDVTSAKLMTDNQGKSKGFGFVNFASHEQAVKCVRETHEQEFKGKTLYAARAQPKAERLEMLKKSREERANKYQGVNLYIKNLDESVTEEELKKTFEHCGKITSVKIMSNEKGVSKGFGFVCYSSHEEANKALSSMSNHMLKNKPLYVAIAQRKEQRRAQLEAQFAQRNSLARQAFPGMGLTPHLYANPMFYPGPTVAPNTVNQNRAFSGMPPYTQLPYARGRGYPGPNNTQVFNPHVMNQQVAMRNRGGANQRAARGQRPVNNNARKAQAEAAPVPPTEQQASSIGDSLYDKVQSLTDYPSHLSETIVQILLHHNEDAELEQLLQNESELKVKIEQAAKTASESAEASS